MILSPRNLPLWLGLILPLVGIGAAMLAGASAGEQANLAARWTARAAAPLFLVTYLASTLLRLRPGAATRAVMRHRRQWGLGFALAHSIHLIALGINITIFAERPWQSLIPGALAYALMFVMAVTSTDGWQRRLGRWWRHIHRAGIHYLWFIFTASYALRAFGTDPEKWVEGWMMTPVMVAALALRLWAGSTAQRARRSTQRGSLSSRQAR
jgi:methionine sulfoxide reductase heme-binding subunit